MSLCTLAEQVRTHGKTVVTVAWSCRHSEQDRLRKIANSLVLALSEQQFCQDWAVELREEKEEDANTNATKEPSETFLPRMNVSFGYFDADGVMHKRSVWDSVVDSVDGGFAGGATIINGSEFSGTASTTTTDDASDIESPPPPLPTSQLASHVLQVIEACIRGVTTQSNRLLHAYLRNTFRSRLWSEEFGSSSEEMGFSLIFAALGDVSTGTSVEELMVHQHALLPARRAKLHTRIIQKEFVEGLWIAGMLSKMPHLCAYAVSMAIRTANSRLDAEREATRTEVDRVRSMLSSSSAAPVNAATSSASSTAASQKAHGGISPLARLRTKAKLAGALQANFGGFEDKDESTTEMHEDALVWVDGLQVCMYCGREFCSATTEAVFFLVLPAFGVRFDFYFVFS